jgi:superfamily II DNA or RNA helicase
MLTKGKGSMYYFWAGLLDRVLEHCAENGIEVEVVDKAYEEFNIYEPELPGITFRPDQASLINSFLDKPRGILESFTGSGKTVLGFGCLSAFPDYRALWLCHTKGLMQQAYDEACKFGFKSVGRVGDGHSEYTKDITIATRQSFKRLADEFGHEYDIVVVDEVHHVADLKSEYAYVLARVPAPIRLGLSATLHKEGTEAWYTSVGLLGPILQSLSINDGAELGILATPTIRILRCPKDHEVSAMKMYSHVYSAGVVNNLYMNNLIAVTAKKHSDANETVLIMINQIEHGENIQRLLDALHVKNIFIRGATKSEVRDDTKHALNRHEINVVICSSVWTEGINIPTLQVVINAAGGKDEKAVLQKVGRGLRKTAEKDSVIIYDTFNVSHRYLIEHFGERLCIYLDNNWL